MQNETEIIRRFPSAVAVAWAVFDHDGTLSTLREGWEEVMRPMMAEAILGASADPGLRRRVEARVAKFVDETTGIQTLVQMHGLVELVHEFGRVPASEILDPAGYKRLYNDALMARVRVRQAGLLAGTLSPSDFTIAGAAAFVRLLQAAGVRLALASGTDQADVEAEATALGYADAFAGGIHGAVGDIAREAKREVLERILREAEPDGTVVVFGDGPVEMREAKRFGAYAVGVASDEVRRRGLNLRKRSRLLAAGADAIVPDFADPEPLLAALGMRRMVSS